MEKPVVPMLNEALRQEGIENPAAIKSERMSVLTEDAVNSVAGGLMIVHADAHADGHLNIGRPTVQA